MANTMSRTVDTKWVDSDKAFGEEPMHIRSRIVARECKDFLDLEQEVTPES